MTLSIKFKLLALMIGSLVIATISILIAANNQFIGFIDKNQYSLYSERVDSILTVLQGYEDRLQMTGQVEAYSDGFRELALKTLRETYYQQKNQRIFPFIITPDGDFLMHPQPDAGKPFWGKFDIISKVLSSKNEKSGSFEFEKKWYLYKHFDDWDWVVAYIVPLEIKYLNVYTFRQILILIMIAISTITIIIMWLMIRRITKPIEILMQSTRAIAAGNYSSITGITGSDEMNQLGCNFNQMTEAINKKIVDLNREIKERHQAENSLKKNQERLSIALKGSNSGIWDWNIKTGDVFFDDNYYIIAGYKPNEFPHRYEEWEKRIHPDDIENVKRKIQSYISGEAKEYVVEFRFKTKKNDWMWIIAQGKIFEYDDEGNPNRFTGTHLDITERKHNREEKMKLKSQLHQSQKMESIGRLAGGIAHDFNNLLFSILGYTEMLIEDTPEKSSFKDSLNEIYTGALRGKELVKQILTFSRQDTMELKLMKMQPVVLEALKLVRSTIPTTIEIKQDIRPDCGVIKADPTQIHQIITNLATNAYHAMEETGGELKVSLKEIRLDNQDVLKLDIQPGDYVCLKISDTGIGMDKTLIEKIFDPFFTTKIIGKGTGMGLAVVHGIVKSLGGSIHVYSEPGKGTEFYVYFPLEKSPSEKQITKAKEPIEGGSEQILLVDDEESLIKMERQMLERLGYQVISHTSSIEALEFFKTNYDKFDLIITDMAMPNLSGDKLASELNKIRPDIPILLCTGFSEVMSEEKALSLGIDGFLMKPVVMRDLSKKIRDVLDIANPSMHKKGFSELTKKPFELPKRDI